MTDEIRFGWHILYRARSPLFRKLVDSPLFLVREPEKYFNRISAVDPTLYHPVDFQPTNLFHRALRTALAKRFDIKVLEKNFPYTVSIPLFGASTRLSVFVQVYLADIISVKIILHSARDIVDTVVFKQRQFHNHPLVRFVSNFTALQVETKLLGSSDWNLNPLQAKPLMYVKSDSDGNEFLKKNRAFLAALVINDEYFRDSSPSIMDRLFERNAEHNAKSERSRLILINKQAFLAVTTNSSSNYEIVAQEIRKRERLFELGSVLQRFYETYPSLRIQYMREMDYLFFATQSYIKRPTLTFKLSYGNTLAWELIMDSFKLDEGFENARRFDVESASQISNLFDKVPQPKYSDPAFWAKVENVLGDQYMANNSGGYQINIGTNRGSVAAGPSSTATTLNVSAENAEAFGHILTQLSTLRSEIVPTSERKRYDLLITQLRSEIKKEQPDRGIVRESLKTLRNIVEGTAGSLTASGLIFEGIKLLGLS